MGAPHIAPVSVGANLNPRTGVPAAFLRCRKAVLALAILVLLFGIASFFCANHLVARIHHSRRHSQSSARHVAARFAAP